MTETSQNLSRFGTIFATIAWLLLSTPLLSMVACDDDPSSPNRQLDVVDDADAGADVLDVSFDSDAELDAEDIAETGDVQNDWTDLADSGVDSDALLDVTFDAVDAPDTIDVELLEGCNPLTTSEECFLPYPSAFFQVPDESTTTGVRLAYHNDLVELPPGARNVEFTVFNLADGAPPSTPILVHFGVDIAADQLVDIHHLEDSTAVGFPIAVFNLDTGERVLPLLVEMDQNLRSGFDGRHALIIRPLTPMQMGVRHLAVLTDELRDSDGEELASPLAFSVLRDDVLTSNSRIESVRADYETHFDFLDDHGYPRDELLLAWDFMVASDEFVFGSVLSMRERALDDVADNGIGYVIEQVTDDPNVNVARIVEGTFEVPNFLNESNVFEYNNDHHPIQQDETISYPFTMVIPPAAEDGTPLPLAVMGHGIFGNGHSFVTDRTARNYIQPLLAQLGIVAVATDWIGLSSGDLDLIIVEVLPNLNRLRLVTDRLQQSLVNNLVLTELALGELNDDSQVQVGEGPFIDTGTVYYFGGSLGGIQGTSFASLSSRIERAALAVPGGAWSTMINRSTVFAPIKSVADLVFPDPLLQQIYISMLQGFFDHSDPVNMSLLAYRQPLDDAPANRVFVFQEAIGDCLVPNLSTDMLARAVGARQLTPAIAPHFGLETVTGPTTLPVISQLLLPDQVAEYSPPDTNQLPSEDNGVHFDAVIAPKNLEQLLNLFNTGQIQQFCDGACDPE